MYGPPYLPNCLAISSKPSKLLIVRAYIYLDLSTDMRTHIPTGYIRTYVFLPPLRNFLAGRGGWGRYVRMYVCTYLPTYLSMYLTMYLCLVRYFHLRTDIRTYRPTNVIAHILPY